MTEGASLTLALPGARTLALAPELAARIAAGVLVIDGLVVGADAGLAGRLAARFAELREAHAGCKPSEVRELDEARRLYRAAGIDPTRWRPSSEALVRRAIRGEPPPLVNSAVDACNLASVTFYLPIGLYDLEAVTGDVTLRLGRAGEEFPGIRKGPVHVAGRLALCDARGPFGSPSSDSLRTSVGAGTRLLLAVIFATAGFPAARMLTHVDLLASLTTVHGGGRVALRGTLGGATGGTA